MKNSSRILVFLVLAVFLVTGSAIAYPWVEVTGIVAPTSATEYTSTYNGYETTLYDNLTYWFTVVDDFSGTGTLSDVSLQFESDVFVNQNSYTITNINVGWSWYFDTITNQWYVATASSGSELTKGQTLSFSFDGVELYTAALSAVIFDLDGDGISDGDWSEGQIWAQSWNSVDTDGGSTAPVPEPATMLLVGCGLVGMAAVGRKKFSKRA